MPGVDDNHAQELQTITELQDLQFLKPTVSLHELAKAASYAHWQYFNNHYLPKSIQDFLRYQFDSKQPGLLSPATDNVNNLEGIAASSPSLYLLIHQLLVDWQPKIWERNSNPLRVFSKDLVASVFEAIRTGETLFLELLFYQDLKEDSSFKTRLQEEIYFHLLLEEETSFARQLKQFLIDYFKGDSTDRVLQGKEESLFDEALKDFVRRYCQNPFPNTILQWYLLDGFVKGTAVTMTWSQINFCCYRIICKRFPVLETSDYKYVKNKLAHNLTERVNNFMRIFNSGLSISDWMERLQYHFEVSLLGVDHSELVRAWDAFFPHKKNKWRNPETFLNEFELRSQKEHPISLDATRRGISLVQQAFNSRNLRALYVLQRVVFCRRNKLAFLSNPKEKEALIASGIELTLNTPVANTQKKLVLHQCLSKLKELVDREVQAHQAKAPAVMQPNIDSPEAQLSHAQELSEVSERGLSGDIFLKCLKEAFSIWRGNWERSIDSRELKLAFITVLDSFKPLQFTPSLGEDVLLYQDGRTFAQYCARMGYWEVMQVIKELGLFTNQLAVDLPRELGIPVSAISRVSKDHFALSALNEAGKSLAHTCVEEWDVEGLDYLRREGANFQLKDSSGLRPCEMLVSRPSSQSPLICILEGTKWTKEKYPERQEISLKERYQWFVFFLEGGANPWAPLREEMPAVDRLQELLNDTKEEKRHEIWEPFYRALLRAPVILPVVETVQSLKENFPLVGTEVLYEAYQQFPELQRELQDQFNVTPVFSVAQRKEFFLKMDALISLVAGAQAAFLSLSQSQTAHFFSLVIRSPFSARLNSYKEKFQQAIKRANSNASQKALSSASLINQFSQLRVQATKLDEENKELKLEKRQLRQDLEKADINAKKKEKEYETNLEKQKRDFEEILDEKVEERVGPEVERRVGPEVERRVGPEVERRVGPEVERRVGPEVERRVAEIEKRMPEEVQRQVEEQLKPIKSILEMLGRGDLAGFQRQFSEVYGSTFPTALGEETVSKVEIGRP